MICQHAMSIILQHLYQGSAIIEKKFPLNDEKISVEFVDGCATSVNDCYKLNYRLTQTGAGQYCKRLF